MVAKNRALIVGVKRTSYEGLAELGGVWRDVDNMEKLLRGFSTEVLTSRDQVTAENVKDSLRRIVAATGDGDLSVIYLTGHGYQLEDTSGDEEADEKGEYWDEAFVCGDRPILDDWFAETLWPTGKSGARFVVMLDACHSSSAAIKGHVPEVTAPEPKTAEERYWRLYFAACADPEQAEDLGAGIGGAVTSALATVLRRAPHDGDQRGTYKQVFDSVAQKVTANRRVPRPVYSAIGPDDSLLKSQAFVAEGQQGA